MGEQYRPPTPCPTPYDAPPPEADGETSEVFFPLLPIGPLKDTLDGQQSPPLSGPVSRSYPTVLRDGSLDRGVGQNSMRRRHGRDTESSEHNWNNFRKIPPPMLVPGANGGRSSRDPNPNSNLADRLDRAEREENRAKIRKLEGDTDAQPDYSRIKKDRAKAFGAKDVEIPKELLKRVPYDYGDRNKTRRTSNAGSIGAASLRRPSTNQVPASSPFLSVPISSDTNTSRLSSVSSQDPGRRHRLSKPNPLDTERARQASSMARRLQNPPGQVSDFDTITSRGTSRCTSRGSKSYATAPENLRAAPMGTSYATAKTTRPATLPPPSIGTSSFGDKKSQATSRATVSTMTGHYYRHRVANYFRRWRQRRAEKREAKWHGKNNKLKLRMQHKHDAIEMMTERKQGKFSEQRQREAEKESRRVEKLQRTRRKMRRRRERAYSSDEGRKEAGAEDGVEARDFAEKRRWELLKDPYLSLADET